MAYDPKSYLDQALKTGFQPVYSPRASGGDSGETEPEYQGDVATFDDVQVRPLTEFVGQTEQDIGTSQQTGYMVSKPLTGQYEGYFRNDVYDNKGNFLRTTLTEPDTDKYGLKALAQMGLMAASFGGLGPLASGLANTYKGVQALKGGDILGAAASILPGVGQIPGVSSELAGTLKTAGGYAKTASGLQKAIESKDPLALLEATSGIPGTPKVPTELTDILKGVGQANRLREAIRNEDPYALFKEAVGYSKSGSAPKKFGDVASGDLIEGFFDTDEGVIIPDWDVLPEARDTSSIRDVGDVTQIDPLKELAFNAGMTPEGFYLEELDTTPDWAKVLTETIEPRSIDPAVSDVQSYTVTGALDSDDVYEDIESLLARYENQGFADQPSGATDQILEITGRRDDLGIDPWLQPFVDTERRVNVTEDKPQTIDVTGKREGVIIPDWDVLPEAKTAFIPGSDDVYEDIESLLARYENQGFADQPSGATDQSIDITGRKDVIIPDWDVLPDVVTTPRSIRDVGPVTTISPGEKLDIPEIPVPDLSVGLKPAVTGGTKTGTTKTTTDQKKNEIDWAKLFALLGAMNRPQEREEQYQLANMPDYEDLMYGLSSGEMPYMRG